MDTYQGSHNDEVIIIISIDSVPFRESSFDQTNIYYGAPTFIDDDEQEPNADGRWAG